MHILIAIFKFLQGFQIWLQRYKLSARCIFVGNYEASRLFSSVFVFCFVSLSLLLFTTNIFTYWGL